MYTILMLLDERVKEYAQNMKDCCNPLEHDYWLGRLQEAEDIRKRILEYAEDVDIQLK